MPNNIKLKSCPFCGGVPEVEIWKIFSGVCFIKCRKCKSKISGKTMEDTAQKWNMRTINATAITFVEQDNGSWEEQ